LIARYYRWLRVAYYQRYDWVLLVDDDSFVNIANLLDLHSHHKSEAFFYAGSINGSAQIIRTKKIEPLCGNCQSIMFKIIVKFSFERADQGYQHKYYAPFAELGTILLSTDLVEVRRVYYVFLRHQHTT
jgi:hypothetical protein